MRSLLFVPGDSERKIEKAAGSGADTLILDLEDSVAPENKPAARACTQNALAGPRTSLLYVRINALDTGLAQDDLESVLSARPDGIVLPKSRSADDVRELSARLDALEVEHRITPGSTRILPIVTETAASLFHVGTYHDAGPRLEAMSWGAEDLSADLGASANRGDNGAYFDVYRLARTLCLTGAVAAGAAPVDTVYTNFRDEGGLRREAEAAAVEGFTAKLAIHPAQVPVINDTFTPSTDAVARARRIVEAFRDAGDAGVIGLDGEMLDRPHLVRAEKLLARAALYEG